MQAEREILRAYCFWNEGVIEAFSHRDDRASRIASSHTAGDRDNETQPSNIYKHPEKL